jgi:hypothetical protein
MKGLYLYCIRKRTVAPSFSIKGIDGKGSVFVIPFQELEGVISKVSLEEFASEEIQKRAQEDLNWIKEKTVIHEKVIEEAMQRNEEILSVIPMKFGTLFKEKERLEQTLNEHYERFKNTLEKLEGKREWSIKLYLVDKRRFEQEVKSKSKIIMEKEKEIADLPEGVAYFLEGKLKELISRDVDKKLKKTQKAIFNGFKIYAEQSRKGKILGREITGKHEPMILNAYYLIKKEKIDDFIREAESINQSLKKKGFVLEYSGPWPPYNFV